ncbi:MAG: aminotransferase class V-fold PLP-dependent enzyme [Brevundimonas sp.]|uniref:aminotransferase class V-fold PLP-dependent enzyme n=1 Tax=Brevundimonas sp. TaxID=1871086 RepID=UPI00121FBE4A|nr:aminotransferase class V-fold PLP-dependent enzyme [Brevundimonas sp.]RZJ18650.1 MAG: aminotransferase class V-fold PLP-dependent enzyme [Brevundimonas sp.]
MDRRALLRGALVGASAGLAAGAAKAQVPYYSLAPRPRGQVASAVSPASPPAPAVSDDVWSWVRAEFDLDPTYVDLSAMLLASHPRAVREAVDRHRRALDRQPVVALKDNRDLQNAGRSALARYLGCSRNDIALTDSTTSAVALVYNGLKLQPGDEILTVTQDYYVTHEAARHTAAKRGATVRKISIHDGPARNADMDQMVDRVIGAIRPETKVLGLTWVQSSTGLKIPAGRIAERLKAVNADRPASRRIIFCLDGVHGFGNQDAGMAELGCDFLMSGCHKWLFGPRGTGMIAGTAAGWAAVDPTIPSFLDSGAYSGWISGSPASRTTGSLMTPGGFKAFEHLWALPQAFEIHDRVGRAAVAARTAELAGQLKTELRNMRGVTVHTPQLADLSAGIVSFEVAGVTPSAAVDRLRSRRIMASLAPYARPLIRLTPSIRNNADDLDRALAEVRELA